MAIITSFWGYLVILSIMDWMSVSPQNSYIEALTPRWLYLDRGSTEVIKLKEILRVGLWSYRISVLEKETRESLHSLSLHS